MRYVAVLSLCLIGSSAGAAGVSLTVHPDRVENGVDVKVYGHFLEHIYHSCNGGLWGELIWNRSFEQNKLGQWHVADNQIVQGGMGTDQRLMFGENQWSDYELSLEALKTGGNEGFLVLFRHAGDKEFYWVNLGGWSNTYHRIERGLNDGRRWSGIGPRVDGQIETGRWYRIRVRCEGRHFQVFLDDRELIDFTDDHYAHPKGKVGVGTWATTARFRNIKVTSLDGAVLFEGLPESAAQPSTGLHWTLCGDGQAFIDQGDAANGSFCQRIVGRGGETGVQQTPLNVRDGETYIGSVWARGQASGEVVVRLMDSDRTVAEASLGRPTADWREYPFALTSSGNVPNATIRVGVIGSGELWLDQVSLMPESWQKKGGFRPDLLKAIAELQPPIIRWPGGCFASAYRWKQGIGPQHERLAHPREIWDDLDVYSYGTDEFVATCRQVGAEPLIVVNIGTPNWNGPGREDEFLQEAKDWIQYCNGPADSQWGRVRAANGHPEPYGVKFWEIDNETWHMGAEAYADAVNRFGPAMREVDPSIKLIACGSGGYNQQWNRTVIDRAGKNFDYISTHHYENPSRYASGPPEDERFYQELKQVIDQGPNPAIKVYCSEWNVQSTDWRTGLYCGGILNVFERCGEFFEIGGPALFLRHASATAWDNAFINFDHRTWFPAPNYVVMRLWREHYAPHRVVLEGAAGPLSVVATRSDDGETLMLKVVNPSDVAVPVTLSFADGSVAGSAAMLLVAPGSLDARNTLEDPGRVRAVAHPAETDGRDIRFEMPPLSAGVVKMTVIERR